jgi:glucosamine-phosphate N-acetyltransferase
MENINYSNLYDIINQNINHQNIIKSSYINLLNELTICENISDKLFLNNIKKINNSGIIYIAWVGNFETYNFEIIGSGTIFLEPKIIRGGKNVGHIEDIVILKNYRGNKIAQNILNKLKEYALNNNCYKVILDCAESVSNVYKSNGFEKKGLQMVKYF